MIRAGRGLPSTSGLGLSAILGTLSAHALAHPGHQHLDGAPGDMHLHALLPQSPWGLLVLMAVAAIGVLLVRAFLRRSRRK